MAEPSYVLGAALEEQARLRAQGDSLAPLTEHLISESGIERGMRVLDLGCGTGEVSLLLARRVAPEGAVVGVDREAAFLERARARVAGSGLSNVSFVHEDFCALGPGHGSFDAAFGRLVLMHQADPVAAVRSISRRVRPGGVIAFQEYDSILAPAFEGHPLHLQVRSWIWETFRRLGLETHMGLKLYPILIAAGLPPPQVRAEAIVQSPISSYPTVPLIRSLLPRMVALGVTTAAEVDVDTLEERLYRERVKDEAVYVGPLVFAAWTRMHFQASA